MDAGAVKGIAITNVSNQGTLYYSTDNGANWIAASGLNNAFALLLASDGATRLYFVSNTANFNGTLNDAITFRAWDQTTGTNGNTADTTINGDDTAFSNTTDTISITVNPVNDAPTRNGGISAPNLSSIMEDQDPDTISGDTIENLFASKFLDNLDSPSDNFAGIAVVANDVSFFEGQWQWSNNNGFSWNTIESTIGLSNALLLEKNTKIRFLPYIDFNGTPSPLTVRLIDDSSTPPWGDRLNLSDPSTTGGTTPYSDVDNEVTLTTTVTGVNDAPVRFDDQPTTLTAVDEDNITSTGDTVSYLFGGKFSDFNDSYTFYGGSNANNLAGVAIVKNTSVVSQGKWQYSTDNINWIDIANDLSNSNALVLPESTRIRFLPAADFNGTPGTLTARLIDDSQGALTSITTLNFDTLNGGIDSGSTTPYSDADNTVVLNTSVNAVNDAPTRNITKPNLQLLAAEDTGNSGSLNVTALFGSGFLDTADAQIQNGGVSIANEFAGVAIVANEATTNGTWQYFNGTDWIDIPTTLTTATALVLNKDTLVRFKINTTDFTGEIGKLTARLLDNSSGELTSGNTLNVSISNGTEIYSNSSNQVLLFGGVTPINDDPKINPVAIEINEGGSGNFVNIGNFNLTDVDNLQQQLIIKITSLPTRGTLTFNGSQLVVDSTFSADQIPFLRYTHNGNQVLSDTYDSFGIIVEDGAGGTISNTAIPITIKPVNQLPSASGSQTLYEGETGVIIPITISDPDQSVGTPHNIKILTLPVRGTLKVNGSVISSLPIGGLTVLSTDVISYDHDGNDLNNGNPPDESFNIEVIDDGGGTGIPGTTVSTITLNIIPNNDDPTLVNNTGTTLNSGTGREITVTTAMLRVTDPDSSDTQLTYTLTDLPDHGYLLYNDGGTLKRMLVGTTFTQADINNGIIRYRFFESGAGVFNDSFSFQVRDSEITAYPTLREGGIWKTDGTALETITFPLVIEDTTGRGSGEGGETFPDRVPSSPPIVDTNTGVGVVISPATLLEGGSVVITNSLLKVTDPDNPPPSQLVFRIAELPTSGTLKFNGVALRVYDSFTQEDINNGLLTFDHAGDEKFIDNFKFTISDGSNVVTNSGNPFIFDIDVTPQNDAPAIAVSNKPFLREGGTTGISPDLNNLGDYITLVDIDGTGEKSGIGYATPNNLTFQVLTLPTHGYLEIDQGSGYVQITELNKGSIIITKAQLVGNLFRYVHDSSENFTDSFNIQANDNTTGTINNLSNVTTVNIDIAPINDPPQLQEKKNLSVFEGATATIKGSNGILGDESRLIYKDPDNTTIQRQYFISNNVDYGNLFLNGVALGVGSVFSQDDLDNNRITYQHDGSENHQDFFEFEVRDGGGGEVPGIYNIDITPRNDAPTLTIPGVQNYFGNNTISITGIIPADVDLLSLNTPVETDRLRITLNPQLVAGTTYANGKLNITTTTGITFINPTTGLAYSNQVSGTNNNIYGNKIIIEGTLSDIQNALNSLQYQVNTDVNGTISLAVTVDDRLYNLTTGAVIGANGGATNQNGTPFSDTNNTVTRNILINTSSLNDAPQVVISTNSNYAFLTEDQTSPFNGSGSNPGKISIIDPDAFDTINNTVTLTVTTGTISVTNTSLITGGANGTNTIILTGSLTEINQVLESLSYTPLSNYNNFTNTFPFPTTDTLTITADDKGNSGIGGPQQTSRTITLVIRPVNDAPTRFDASPAVAIVAEDTTSPTGNTVFNLFNPKFTDVTDNQLANNGSAPNILAGVAIVGNTGNNLTQGKWQWSSNGTTWTDISTSVSLNSSLILSSNALIRFLPVADFHGTPTGQLTTRLIDSSGSPITSGALLNLSAANATGGTTRYSDAANAVTLQANVTPVNDAPTATTSTVSIATIAEDTTNPSGTQLLGLLNSKYSDVKDNQISKNGGNTATPLSYVAIVGSTNYVAGQGTWQYSDGSGNWINIPVSGLSNTNSLIIPSDREIRFLPASNFFGNPGTLTVKLADNSSVLTASTSSSDFKNLTTNGGIGTTGSWSVNNVTIATNITNVNDAPTIINPTTPVNLTAVNEDTTNPTGATVTTLFGSKYNDSIDNQQGILNGGNAVTAFAGIAIVGNASTSVEGKWEYSTNGGSIWQSIPYDSDSLPLSNTNALLLNPSAQLRFVPALDYYSNPLNLSQPPVGALTIRVADTFNISNNGTLQDITNFIGTKNDGSGVWSNDTTTLATTVNAVNDAPVLNGTIGTTQTTVEDAAPVNVGSNLSGITDIEIGLNQLPDLVTATVTIGNFLVGDQLAFTLPSGVIATANGTGNVYTLSGSSATLANILSALQSTTYVSTSNNPTNIVNGVELNRTRTIQYQINDTQSSNNLSNVITTTVEFTQVSNDSPSLTDASFSINEDPTTNNGQTINTLFAGKFSDDDGADAFLSGLAIISNTANSSTEGTWQYSTDSGTNWFAIDTVNDTGTALALSKDTLIRFVPVQDYNGTPPALQVRALDDTYNALFTSTNANTEVRVTINTTNNGGQTAIAATPTNLGVIVNPINDTPAISGTTGTRAYTENASAIILVTGSGSVVDIDANNFPNGNITLTLTSYQTGDVLSVNNQGSGANQIGLIGSNVTYGGVTIGTINSINNGVGKNLVINFNSQATKTAVQALLDNLTYVSTSDDPTVAGTQNQRTFNVTLNDGNNGGGGVALNSNTLTGIIDITAVNDAPVNNVLATQTTLEDTIRIFNTANGNLVSISDVDAGSQPVTVTLTSTNGIINLSGIAGLTFENGTVNGSNNIKITGTIAAINTALNGLGFAPTANYNNNFSTGSITIVTDDLGNTDAIANQNKTDSDTIIINITPVNDAPVISLIASPVTGNYTEGATAFNIGQNIAFIADIEIDQSEPNVANNFTATATITDFFTGDVLSFTVGATGVTVNNPSNGVYTLTGTKANVLQVLQSTTYSSTSPNPSNYNTNLDRVITYQINDNQGANNLSNTVSTTVNITPVNDPPTVAASSGVTTFTEGNNVTSTPVAVDSGLTLDDVDNEKLASATVSITGNLQNLEDILVFTNNNATLYDNITASYNSTTGVLTLNSVGQTATLAQWQNALRAVTYTNSSEIPNNSDRTISIQINDGAATSNVTTKTVQIVPVNDTPILGTGSTVNYLENATAVAIAPTMTLTNADTDLLKYNNGSSLTINYTSGATIADQLSIANANGITVSGNVISYNGNAIGTFSGGANGTGLTITFNGIDSTSTAVKQLLNNISFSNTSEDPVSGNRVFNITINDNEGGLQTATSSTTVNVIPVNDAPTLTSNGLNPNYVEDTVAFSTIFNGSATGTIEAGQLINQLVFTISNVVNVGNEQVSINGTTVTLTNGATFTSGGFSGTVSLSGSNATVTINNATGATTAQIDALVNGLGYKNTSQDPTGGNRLVTITSITDNGGTANGGVNNTNPNLVSVVNVIPVNDEPTLTATGANTSYTEDVVTPSSLFSSANSGTIEAGQKLKELKLTVNNLNDGANEILRIDGQDITLTNGNNVTTSNGYTVNISNPTGNLASLTITKSGDATTAQINTLINGIGYKNTSQSPTTGNRTITITSLQDDGANGGINEDDAVTNALSITATVNVIAVNDAPVLDNTPVLSITTTEDIGVPSGQVGFLISNFVGGISDVDGVNVPNGIAITNKSNLGSIYYSTNNGTNWTLFSGTLSDSNALLLANNSNTRLFFSPNANINGILSTGITFRAWDQTSGSNGSTANISTIGTGGTTAFSTATETISVTITAVNDAPTRSSASTSLTAVLEDNTNPTGATVNSLFTSRFSDTTDNQTANGGSSANTLAGVVVVANAANTSTQGVWQWYDGSTWQTISTSVSTSNGLVLAENTLVRFLPNANFNGTPGILTTRLIDNSVGAVTSGTTGINVSNDTTLSGGITQYSNSSNAVTLTTSVTAVNDAPIATGASVLTAVNEDSTNPTGATVTTLFNGNFSDSTDQVTGGSSANTLAGVAIVGNAANSTTQGNWQYFNGTSWVNVGTRDNTNALIVASANSLRFVPVTDYHGAVPALTVNLIDSSITVTTGNTVNLSGVGATGGTTAYSVNTVNLTTSINPVNDAPIASGSVSVTNINEDVSNPSGTVINTLITSTNYNDTKDNQTSNGGNNTETALNNIAVVGSSNYVAGQGTWQYGNGSGGWIDIPVSGLSDTQALIIPSGREIRFVPATNFFGTPGTLNVRLADSSSSPSASTSSGDTKNLNSNGSIGGTGTWSSGTVTITSNGITNVNDRPTATNTTISGTLEDNTTTSLTITGANFGYSDVTDNQSGITGGGNASSAFGGIAIVNNPATQGNWQYNTGSGWVNVGIVSDNLALILPENAQLRFVPNANFNGNPDPLSIRVADTSQSFASNVNITGNLTQTSTWSNIITLSAPITPQNDAPIINATISNPTAIENNSTGTGFSVDPVNLFSGASISDIDLTTTSALNSNIFGAGTITVSLTDGIAGDILLVNSSFTLPSGVTLSGGTGSTPLVISLAQNTTLTNLQDILNNIQYRNSSDDPTLKNTDTSRNYTLIISDGNNLQAGGNAGGATAFNSNTLTGTININAVNDAPVLDTNVNPVLSSTEDNPIPVGIVGSLISTFVGGISDLDSLNFGIAITNVTNLGTFWYSTDNGTTWSSIASVSDSNALLLADNVNTRLYFQPNANLNGTLNSGITFRAWDQSQGSNGATANTTTNGSITPFSSITDTIAIAISPVNDAPIATGASVLTAVNEDSTNPTGATVTTLFNGNFS
ncbi:MAG: hypothetical protein FWJ34_12635, partial [Geminocystis sp. GBBB08]|nr:hypothetical protein [Geminocystis sp. GBBB08]